MESSTIHASALVVTQLTQIPSNWRSNKSLSDFLGIQGAGDGRSGYPCAGSYLRSDGEVKGLMVPSDSLHTLDLLREEAMALPSMKEETWPEWFRPRKIISGLQKRRVFLESRGIRFRHQTTFCG